VELLATLRADVSASDRIARGINDFWRISGDFWRFSMFILHGYDGYVFLE